MTRPAAPPPPDLSERTEYICWVCNGRGWNRNGDIDDGRMTGRDTCYVCGGSGHVTGERLLGYIAAISARAVA